MLFISVVTLSACKYNLMLSHFRREGLGAAGCLPIAVFSAQDADCTRAVEDGFLRRGKESLCHHVQIPSRVSITSVQTIDTSLFSAKRQLDWTQFLFIGHHIK